MKLSQTSLPGVLLVEPQIFADDRGFFLESWNAQRFAAAGLDLHFVQDNHSHSTRNVLRGLHYQLDNPQGKLVRVTSGAVFDVAVDLRRSSPHFGHWTGHLLTAENHHMLWVPPGFAHGFAVTSAHADVQYKCTALYDAADDRAVRWDDPALGIDWPVTAPLLSAKDAAAPCLADAPVSP